MFLLSKNQRSVNLGDRNSFKDRVVGPLPNGLFMAYKWGLLTTYPINPNKYLLYEVYMELIFFMLPSQGYHHFPWFQVLRASVALLYEVSGAALKSFFRPCFFAKKNY